MKLTNKERAKATVNYLLSNHILDLDDAYDLIASIETEADASEAETLIEMLTDYHEYLKDELEAACPDEN